MDIDLRLPSKEHENEVEGDEIVTMLDGEGKPLSVDEGGEIMGDLEENLHVEENGEDVNSSLRITDYRDITILEPLPGMEFGSHGNAYAFYQEYARSVGFNTAIQNSRRSKTSREFIDAKFACSRYGTKREYEKSANRPRSRQGSKQDAENATGRRACSKTDCKASMHVKRRADGKWIIHRFEKEHNHELLPAQAVSEQTRLMYADMARQFAEYKTAFGHKNDSKCPFDKGRSTSTDPVDAHILLEFFSNMKSLNSNFFYAVDVDGDQRLKNVLWIDAKSRHDYASFNDIVSFDTFYVRNKYKIPLAMFIGVNQHYQFMLLGCALLSDESTATYLWVMQTWLKAMGGQAPKAIIADQDQSVKSVVSEVFPSTLHIFCLCQIMAKVSEALAHTIKHTENFMSKLEKCIYRSWTEDEFERRWHKFGERFDVKGNALLQSLYEDREKWVPAFMRGILLAGMAACPRSESVNCLFDKYVHKKTSLPDFIKQYETIMLDRYEEEAKASSDTWNKQPALKSPSPFEKHLAGVYTQAVFRKFQVEVLGAVACIPKQKEHVNGTTKFDVQDFEKNQDFMVTFNEQKSEVSCMCHLFELKGFLCRHTMIVLQICGISVIPSLYILKRWTRDAKSRFSLGEVSEQVQSRLQRYNDLCQRAIKLCEEGSLSQESYNLTLRALDEASDNCFNFNNSSKNLLEAGPTPSPGILCIADTIQIGSSSKTNKKKNQTKKRKVDLEPTDVVNATLGAQESMQQMEKMNSRPVNFDGYFGSQQAVPGMVQLNLMGPTRDSYYGNQQTIQGLGQLNSIAPTHEGYYGPQPTAMHGLGQMDFFRTPNFGYNIRQEEANGRSAQLHDEAPRHV